MATGHLKVVLGAITVVALVGALLVFQLLHDEPDSDREQSKDPTTSEVTWRAVSARDLEGTWRPTNLFGEPVGRIRGPRRGEVVIRDGVVATMPGCYLVSGPLSLGADGVVAPRIKFDRGASCSPWIKTGPNSARVFRMAEHVQVADGRLEVFDADDDRIAIYRRIA